MQLSPMEVVARVDVLGLAGTPAETFTAGGAAVSALRFASPLSRDVLERVRPPSTPTSLPGLDWLDHVDDDRATALRLFVEG
ncbi:hypothetical protein AB0L05_19665 [Nonomuraea pusilla]|uniref:hypothetical protein n=1 Tax=Nonomuraea pusilla TaxID=46177 RepID=UPI003321657C